MKHDSNRREDCQRGRVLDAVVGLNEFHPEAAQVHGLSVLHNLALGILHQPVFLQLVLYQGNGQLGAVYRHVDLLKDIGKGADMVFMSMGNHKALYLINILLQIADIRYHQVNAQHIVSRECKAAVHDDDAVFILKRSDVHSNLLQAA